MEKSTRHSKIAGDFGENLILYWLSRSGFEATLVDHTGIDIVAFRQKAGKPPGEGERIGISVKSRSKKEKASKGLLVNGKDYKKIKEACKFFGCNTESIAFVFDRASSHDKGKIEVYLLTLQKLDTFYPVFAEGKDFTFSVAPVMVGKYEKAREIRKVEFDYTMTDWP